jgi:ribosomal protein S14
MKATPQGKNSHTSHQNAHGRGHTRCTQHGEKRGDVSLLVDSFRLHKDVGSVVLLLGQREGMHARMAGAY